MASRNGSKLSKSITNTGCCEHLLVLTGGEQCRQMRPPFPGQTFETIGWKILKNGPGKKLFTKKAASQENSNSDGRLLTFESTYLFNE